MQINLFKIKKNFKKKNLELNPTFYWKIIVALVFVLTICSFVFGYYVFSEMQRESDLSMEGFTRKQPIKKERLDKALEYFSSREKKSIDILSSPVPIVDPSI